MPDKQETSTSQFIPISPSMGPLLQAEHIQKKAEPFNLRVLYLCWLALLVAVLMGFVAKGLVLLINCFSNLFFFGTISSSGVSPAGNHLGLWVILIPAIGGIIVGLMARYGSVAIRGHGIPEAMEQVLENESKIPPKITFLKPISAAIAIGTGGPFGAEGPIIATGGAMGSLLGQMLKTTPQERKILLAAGATAGMAAVFGSPVSAVLLAVELLLFEFSARTLIPVTIACVTGAAIHLAMEGPAPVFEFPLLLPPTSGSIGLYIVIGTFIGVLGVLASKIVYWVEDRFEKLPVHWMWWPALGGLAVGVIGYFVPATLGVGYDNIKHVLSQQVPIGALFLLCTMKFMSWSIALGSGTSGGTLAPLLTIGSAAGALACIALNTLIPSLGLDPGMAALIGMAAMFTGASRALLTSIVFAFETTLQPAIILPLLGACSAAYAVSYLLMKNTIMTEKIARRGIVVPDSYSAGHFDRLTAVDALLEHFYAAGQNDTIQSVKRTLLESEEDYIPDIILIMDEQEHLVGYVRTPEVIRSMHATTELISTILNPIPGVLFEDSKLDEAISLMTDLQMELIPVLNRKENEKVLGIITSKSILSAYEGSRQKHSVKNRTIHMRKRSQRIFLRAKNINARKEK
jgi:CIC family chloride channel protein